MIKILKDSLKLLYLRPNCLLTRKPVLVVSWTSQHGWQRIWSWPKRRLFQWQISRHGYPTKWPVPKDLILHKNPAFHYLDADQIKLSKSIDFLIICAENDYHEGNDCDLDQ